MREHNDQELPGELHPLAQRLRDQNKSASWRTGFDPVTRTTFVQIEGVGEVIQLQPKAALELGAALMDAAHRSVGERMVLCGKCKGMGIITPKGTLG